MWSYLMHDTSTVLSALRHRRVLERFFSRRKASLRVFPTRVVNTTFSSMKRRLNPKSTPAIGTKRERQVRTRMESQELGVTAARSEFDPHSNRWCSSPPLSVSRENQSRAAIRSEPMREIRGTNCWIQNVTSKTRDPFYWWLMLVWRRWKEIKYL